MAFDQGDIVAGQVRCHLEYLLIVQRAEIGQHQADAQEKPKIPDAVYKKCLQVGVDRCLAGEPEADQQVGHETHRFPAEEQL